MKIKRIKLFVCGNKVFALVLFGRIPTFSRVPLNFGLFRCTSRKAQTCAPLEGPSKLVRKILPFELVKVPLKGFAPGVYKVSLGGQYTDFIELD